MYIIIINIENYNHGIMVGILHSLGIGLSEGDDFIKALPWISFNFSFWPSCNGADIIFGKSADRWFFYPRLWFQQAWD